jgi:hypothetical protein
MVPLVGVEPTLGGFSTLHQCGALFLLQGFDFLGVYKVFLEDIRSTTKELKHIELFLFGKAPRDMSWCLGTAVHTTYIMKISKNRVPGHSKQCKQIANTFFLFANLG